MRPKAKNASVFGDGNIVFIFHLRDLPWHGSVEARQKNKVRNKATYGQPAKATMADRMQQRLSIYGQPFFNDHIFEHMWTKCFTINVSCFGPVPPYLTNCPAMGQAMSLPCCFARARTATKTRVSRQTRCHQHPVDHHGKGGQVCTLPHGATQAPNGMVQMQGATSVKPVDIPQEDDDDHHTLKLQSSNDPSIPLPTTTLTSFMPGDFSPPDQNPSTQGTLELVPAQDDDEERTEPYEDDDTPVLTEEDIAQLQEEDVDTEPYNSDHFHFVDVAGTVFVPIGPKLTGAPDFGSYDVSGFNRFEQYLAKNGKKQPKAECVITQEVLRKYAKEIKQAKLEEFRSFLDFTAMTFRDKRRHKIDNYVTGRWVLTIKVDKDGQFKKFKTRWVCRGFQDAQKYDLQTDSPTATR